MRDEGSLSFKYLTNAEEMPNMPMLSSCMSWVCVSIGAFTATEIIGWKQVLSTCFRPANRLPKTTYHYGLGTAVSIVLWRPSIVTYQVPVLYA